MSQESYIISLYNARQRVKRQLLAYSTIQLIKEFEQLNNRLKREIMQCI